MININIIKIINHIKSQIMDNDKLLCNWASGCLVVFLGSLAIGFLACFGALIYLIICSCGS